MTDRVEMPEMLRAAMIARGLDPDAVAAEAATVDLDAPDAAPAPPEPPAPDGGQESLLGVMAPPDGAQLRDEGMARAEHAAPPDWKDAAWNAILHLADAGADFTADDVWGRVGFSPPEPRALGPLLVRAQRAGLIRATGQHRKSERSVRHTGNVAVWEPVS